MVARGRGKKAAAAVAVAASEAESVVVANGNGNETEAPIDEVVASVPPTKKGRQRGGKKEIKDEVDETPPVEVVEKPTKPAKAAKGSKKASKGKAAVVAEEEEAVVPVENIKKDVPSEDDVPSVEAKPVVAEKKTHHRKRKSDSTEKAEEVPVAKKAPRVTKTKGAKKETVDSDGIPEDPAAVSNIVIPEAQTNGTKKPASRKRGATKIEEPLPQVEESIPEEPEEIVEEPVAKKASKSKSSKKETKKSAPKSKGSKKAQKIADEAEEEVAEHDVLPEDEFVPEIEEEEEPKPKKLVKSKGSRKQLKDDIILPPQPVEEEKVAEAVKEETEEPTVSEPQESEADSAIDEEQQTKPKGKKAPAAKKEKATTKKAQSKKAAKTKKATKDETQEQQQADDNEEDENLNNKEHEDAVDSETSKPKTNGTVKSLAEPVEKKTGRGRKRTGIPTPNDEADETDGSKIAKPDIFLNPTQTEYNASDFTVDKKFNLKISSWNIAGLRSWLKKDGLNYLQYEQPDILCLQEIKCTPDQMPEEARIPGYHPYWLCMPGGYAGVAVYSKIMPINVEYGIGNAEHDDAGRMITAEYEKFYLISVYVPNSGRKLVNLDKRMKWEELFRQYVQKLEKVKPVIIAGDMNVAHNEIDLANPKTNTKNAGFTPQEREAMTKLMALGYVDTFRHLHPNEKGAYTFWSYMGKARSKNVGWRLDYFILSERITSKVMESLIRPQVLGSDHCPITLFLNI